MSRSPSASRLGARLSGVKVTSMGPALGFRRWAGPRAAERGAEGRGDIPRAPARPPPGARSLPLPLPPSFTRSLAHSLTRSPPPAPRRRQRARQVEGRGGCGAAARGRRRVRAGLRGICRAAPRRAAPSPREVRAPGGSADAAAAVVSRGAVPFARRPPEPW